MKSNWHTYSFADVTNEEVTRLGELSASLPVFGVDRNKGLTPEGRYQSKDLSRYKVIESGMFAYNPMRLNIGSIGLNKTQKGLVSPDYVVFSCNPDLLDPRFLAYFIETSNWKSWIARAGTGSVRIRIYYRELSRMPITLPPILEQEKIVCVLDHIDQKINLLREMNVTLESIAQALFKSWFVDFDPVRAKAEGRAPEGMDETTAALFPDGFEDSGLGFIPDGWSRLPFTNTVEVIGGGTPKTSIPEYWDGDIPWFSVVDAPAVSDVFVIDTEKHITEIGLRNSSTKLLPIGTTIISARGTVGRLALVGRTMAMNQSCYGLRGKAGDAYFTYLSISHLVETLKQRTHGSVFDTITRDTLAGVSIVYPSTDIIQAFENMLEPIMGHIKKNIEQAHTLAELRDTLLPRLISGQLRVPEAVEKTHEILTGT